jgi:hypothetical protein
MRVTKHWLSRAGGPGPGGAAPSDPARMSLERGCLGVGGRGRHGTVWVSV